MILPKQRLRLAQIASFKIYRELFFISAMLFGSRNTQQKEGRRLHASACSLRPQRSSWVLSGQASVSLLKIKFSNKALELERFIGINVGEVLQLVRNLCRTDIQKLN